jgi:pimeloyl-ACP methyl ester carboxylesterase
LLDYTLWAARAAGTLPYPVLVGHGLGGWLIQKLLEVVDLPCLLLAPWPAGSIPWPQWRFFIRHQFSHLFYLFLGRAMPPLDPDLMEKFWCQGTDIGQLRQVWPGCAQEPPGVMLDYLLGLSRPKPEDSSLPRLVIGFAADRFITPAQVKRTAERLKARHLTLPGSHIPWWGPEGEELLHQSDEFLSQLKVT